MVGFLGTNVGEHLEAAVTNVLTDGHQHFEQALAPPLRSVLPLTST